MSLLDRYLRAEQEITRHPFLAPVVRGGQVAVRHPSTRAIHLFPAPPRFEGWGVFRPLDGARVRVEREAEEWERLRYLELLPALRAILVHPLWGRSWLAVPWNRADARQRGLPAEPFPAHLVGGGQPLDRVVVRFLGGHAWFEGLDPRDLEPWRAQALRERLEALADEPGGGSPEERLAYGILLERERAARMPPEERRLRAELAHLGGELVAYEPVGEGWRVRWRDGGRTYETLVSRDLTVLSAGICLSGRDEDFDLASIVSVMREARDRGGYY